MSEKVGFPALLLQKKWRALMTQCYCYLILEKHILIFFLLYSTLF